MTTKPPEIVAWDSTVTIDCVGKKESRYQWIRPMILRAQAGELFVVVSTMAIAETFRIEGETNAEAERIVREFFDRKWVEPYAADRRVCEVAALIRRDHGTTCIDSLHLATALVRATPIFMTNDGTNPKKKKPLLPLHNLLELEGHRLQIMTPQAYDEMKRAEANPLIEMSKTEQPADEGEAAK